VACHVSNVAFRLLRICLDSPSALCLYYPLGIIEATKDFLDYYVLGRLNNEKELGYEEIPKGYYRPILIKSMIALMKLQKMFFIKKELLKNLDNNKYEDRPISK